MGMVTRLKNSRKKRGSVSCGFGRVGRHRKHPTGRGKSGGQHHHKILFSKYHKSFFGKTGFRLFRINKKKYSINTIEFSYIFNFKNYIIINLYQYIMTTIYVKVINMTLRGKSKILGKPTIYENTCIYIFNNLSKYIMNYIKKKFSVILMK